jgi:predicted phosphate transport protein (TIGR00153 family)
LNLFNFGKDQAFFDLLERQAEAALQAAKTLHSMTKDYKRLDEYAGRIDEIEHQGDQLGHELAEKADSTFVTPLDKEDLHSLSSAIDNVTDAIQAISRTLAIYRIPDLRTDIEPLATILVQILDSVKDTVGCLRKLPGREAMNPLLTQIDRLEKRGDDTHRKAIASMFHSPARDPFLFIAWKEIYDLIETAINDGEKVAKLVESMAVKYA